MTADCANCGNQVTFKDRFSVYGVCPYCKTMLVRIDDYTNSLGTIADLPDDNSPIQIGTHGTIDGRSFEIIGRLKVRYDKGLWNEWYCYFNDMEHGWLAEAQGHWMLSFEAPEGVSLPAKETLKLYDDVSLADSIYKVIDIKHIEYAGVEGELPFKVAANYKSTVIDLGAPGKRFATLDYSHDPEDKPRAYAGYYVDFDEMNLKNLVALEGWKFD